MYNADVCTPTEKINTEETEMIKVEKDNQSTDVKILE
jgi:hypothetical protein